MHKIVNIEELNLVSGGVNAFDRIFEYIMNHASDKIRERYVRFAERLARRLSDRAARR